MRLGELVVGRRVVVRHRLPDGSASDALGDLVAADEQRLVVATRRGEVVVQRTAVLAAKAVPPAPERRKRRPGAETRPQISTDALELEAAEHWRPQEREDLGAWRLRAAGGFTGRANSALAVGDPGCDLDTALERVRAFYAARDLEAVVAAPTGALAEELERRGWTVRTPTLVMTAPVPGASAPEPTVRFDAEPDERWLTAYQGRGPVGPAGRAVLLSADRQVFASLREDDEVLAVARGSLSAGGWLGLSAVETAPAHRRRGLAGRLTGALLAWGAQQGATAAFLQVAASNAAARALYERAGFAPHHEYRYLVAPV
ncbi:GNAT family N-acetyltransferase [Quadrisphaera sp. INWT6]|uniref:GNAT family N-acetyltransferase n=1 Tax=Quadrisphaera sp. INWT6 TaxID=2596917 RepID=UPI0019D69AD9|nr:GNAT family N-acetyltransferase [Quadrisphaera sp. INWT6]